MRSKHGKKGVLHVGLCNGGVANNPLMGMTANNNELLNAGPAEVDSKPQ